jgi:hypothetical protein
MVRNTITILECLGVETFKISKRKKAIILEILGINSYQHKKRIKAFMIV